MFPLLSVGATHFTLRKGSLHGEGRCAKESVASGFMPDEDEDRCSVASDFMSDEDEDRCSVASDFMSDEKTSHTRCDATSLGTSHARCDATSLGTFSLWSA